MSLGAVLGMSMFVVAAVTTVFVISFQQARLVDVAIENTAEYENAISHIKATLRIIARDQNLEPDYLSDLERYLGVAIADLGNGAYSVVDAVDANQSLTSYFVYAEGIETTYETFLQYTGSEPGFTLDPTVQVETLLGSYMTQFVEVTYGLTAPALTTFQSVMTYYENTVRVLESYVSASASSIQNMANPTISKDTYVTGSVSIANNKNLSILHANCFINGNLTLGSSSDLTISDGNVLIIDGSLTIKNNARISGGTIVVKGNVVISSSNNDSTEYIQSTLYVRDTLSSDRNVVFGSVAAGPTFLFVGLNVNLDSHKDNTASGILYAVCENFYGNNSSVVLSGGVYANNIKQLSMSGIAVNPNLDQNDHLFLMGVADTLGNLTGETSGFRSTFPTLNESSP
jgi:hypothetical protein